MGKYRVVAGQNIYDVALYLYGSIEGVVDLLIIGGSGSSICNRSTTTS